MDQKNRSSSYPYISGDTFRAFCDVIIDETITTFNPKTIKNGDAIFLKTEYMGIFFSKIHPRLKVNYVLVTHNSDCAVPGDFAKYLDDPKLSAWFGQNIDRQHPKLFPIPIGIANSHWPHGNPSIIADAQKRSLDGIKDIVLYVNYTASTNFGERERALSHLNKFPFTFVSLRKSFEDYMVDLAHSLFVLSPPGNGPDCHRTWEALYVGAIPIVKNNSIIALYKDLPVLIVDDWQDIDEEMLVKQYHEISSQTNNLQKLYADYWFNEILKAKQAALDRELIQ